MTWEWITFTAIICTFIAVIVWVAAWNAHKERDDSRIRTFGGSRPGVQMSTSGGTVPERDDDE
jgi:hypothetical protein